MLVADRFPARNIESRFPVAGHAALLSWARIRRPLLHHMAYPPLRQLLRPGHLRQPSRRRSRPGTAPHRDLIDCFFKSCSLQLPLFNCVFLALPHQTRRRFCILYATAAFCKKRHQKLLRWPPLPSRSRPAV